MESDSLPLSYEVDLKPGQRLQLPSALVDRVGPGHWVVTIQPAESIFAAARGHSAFLNSYANEDEGLYDIAHG